MRNWSTLVSDSRCQELRASGVWQGRTIAQHALDLVNADPGRILVIDGERTLSAFALFDEATKVARALLERGLRAGDVVSYMLPNWYESCVLNLAAAMAGVVLNPLLPIYRERELEFMLGDSGSRLLFIPEVFRNVDYVELIARVRGRLPDLRDVAVVRSTRGAQLTFDDLVEDGSRVALPDVAASAVKLLIYTSGTTGRPKGVLHSHETILADVRSLAVHWGVTSNDVFFVPSPVTHIGGSLYAHEFPWFSGTPAALLDTWSGGRAVQMIDEHRCTISAGATPFLRDLMESASAAGTGLKTLRLFICGGAAVPPELIRNARKVLTSCVACRAYGSTETPTVTSGTPLNFDESTCADTDGIPCGAQVRVVNESEQVVEAGQTGEVIVWGPEMFLGYARSQDNAGAFTRSGFFRTGDLGFQDVAGRLTITGRKKDLIIRFGENISPKELEDLLGTHPTIAEVAVVGVPSERSGEAVCACLVAKPGTSITLSAIASFMIGHGAARQKIPEALLLVDCLPRTATGKVRKDVLRDLAASSRLITERPELRDPRQAVSA
jgi:acyl-CoA synthetase (AMP-forming)/AMP-acid ligase II